MYTELVVIYILLAVFAILHILTIFLLFNLLKNKNKAKADTDTKASYIDVDGIGVAFCKKCNVGFDAKYNECPKCGSPR